MSKARAEASNIGIGSDVSQQQRLVTSSLATFQVTPKKIGKRYALTEALETD